MRVFLTLFILLFTILAFVTFIDESAVKTLDESIQRAFISFGLAKGLNGIISLLQGTELSIAPAGIGLNLSVGEILDPFNDMVERFSWVMLASTISLGIQKILLVFSSNLIVKIGIVLSGVFSIVLLWIKNNALAKFSDIFIKIFLIFLILRFFAVGFIYSSDFIYQTTLKNEYKESTTGIEKTKVYLDDFKEQNQQNAIKNQKEDNSLTSFFTKKYNDIKQSINIEKRFSQLQQKIDSAYKNIINIITIFVFQTIFFPLLFLWLLIGIIKYIYNMKIQYQ